MKGCEAIRREEGREEGPRPLCLRLCLLPRHLRRRSSSLRLSLHVTWLPCVHLCRSQRQYRRLQGRSRHRLFLSHIFDVQLLARRRVQALWRRLSSAQ